MSKPILCLDFDGVLHSYTSGWQGVDVIPDPPTPGAMAFLKEAIAYFDVQIFSSRSNDEENGIRAMQDWLRVNLQKEFPFREAMNVSQSIRWPTQKPPAMVTLDDRAIQFTGEWPTVSALLKFQPWNKK